MKVSELNNSNGASFKSSSSVVRIVAKKGDDALTKLLDREVSRKVREKLNPTIDRLNDQSGYKEPNLDALTGDNWLVAFITKPEKPFRFNSGQQESPMLFDSEGTGKSLSDKYLFSVNHDRGENELNEITVSDKNLFGLYSIKSTKPITIAGDWKSKHIFTWDKATFVDSLSKLISEQIEKLLPKN